MRADADLARSAAYGFVCGLAFVLLLSVALHQPAAYAHLGCPAAAINGTAGDDMLFGDGGNDASHDHADTVTGLGGGDYIEGYSCDDILSGGDGQEEIHGGFGNDSISGGPANDSDLVGQGLFLGNGNDTADGDAGADGIFSSSNASDTDTLRGDADNDRVDGSDTDANDSVQGNAGTNDTCWFNTTGGGPPFDSTSTCETVFPVPI